MDIPAYPIRACYYLGSPSGATDSLSGEHYGVALEDLGFETKIASRQDVRYRMTAFML